MPSVAADPDGRIPPLNAHIARANPRTPATEANRILGRSYSLPAAVTAPPSHRKQL